MGSKHVFFLLAFLFLTGVGPCDDEEKVAREGQACLDEGILVCGTSPFVGNVVALSCVDSVYVNSGDCLMCSSHGDDTSFVNCSDGVYSAVAGSPCDSEGIGVCTLSRSAELICSNGTWGVLSECVAGTQCGFTPTEQVSCF